MGGPKWITHVLPPHIQPHVRFHPATNSAANPYRPPRKNSLGLACDPPRKQSNSFSGSLTWEGTLNELSRALTLPFSEITISRESRVASSASHKR